MKNSKNKLGFTLVEVLVASAIVIAASTIVVGIITTTFRTSNKTSSVEEVRKNGNYAISQFSKQTQFADVFEGVSVDGSLPYDSNCNPGIPYNYLKIKKDGIIKTFACYSPDGNPGVWLDNDSLIDTDSVVVSEFEGLPVCEITCSGGSTSSPIVGLDFSLSLADEAKSNVPEGNVNIDFSTSVKMRNF